MTTYERDFYAWTHEQTTLLRDQQFTHLDIDNLIAEIESIGRSERRQLVNRLEILLMHLLKWQHQPALRGRSWELTITEQRRRIAKVLRDNPSLRPELPDLLPEAYDDAAFSAIRATGLPETTFPATCPFTLAEVLGEGWLPA